MLGPAHIIARLGQSGRQSTGFKIHLRPQKGKLEFCYLDPTHTVARSCSRLHICVGHEVQQVITCRVWMTLDDNNAFGHSEYSVNRDLGSNQHVTRSVCPKPFE